MLVETILPSIDAASIASQTRQLAYNQDSMAYMRFDVREANANYQVTVICLADGMTTLDSPHIASSLAVQSALQALFNSRSPWNQRPVEMLIAANDALLAHPSKQNFGTTLSVFLTIGNNVHLANLGDDRVYRIAGSQISCLTRDHSKLAERLGRNPTNAEAKQSQASKKLARSLGEKRFEAEYVFSATCQADPGCTFILCTDGFWTEFEEHEILSLSHSQIGAQRLAELALERDNTDDISVVLLRF